MAIYTKTGDNGYTSLASGTRVKKDDERVEIYGTIDELNSFIGLLYSLTKYDELIEIQKTLFSIGGYYANENAVIPYVKEEDIEHIEFCIDCLEKSLPVLQSFILPGGVAEASISHICRTICRRAERRMVPFKQLADSSEVNLNVVYMNRLSDYFFLLARRINKDKGIEEIVR